MTTGHVLMTADAVGGVWTYALDLAGGLSRQDVRTTLVLFGPDASDDQRARAARVAGLELIETKLPLEWTARESAEIEESAAALRGLAKASGADLVHLNSPALAIGGGFSAPVVGVCHSCVATWWSAVQDGPPPYDFSWRIHAIWRGMLNCDALVAPSHAFARATSETYDIPPPYVVRNGRAAPPPAPGARRRASVFTSGRLWDAGKNLRTLDAAAKLTPIPVRAAGPLSDPAGGGSVEFAHLQLCGPLTAEQVRAELSQRGIYASSALYEPFGLGVLEAAQAGCALVLSDIPTFRELWEGAAEFAPADDPAAFAAAFDRLHADEGLSNRLGAAARQRAALYTPEAMTRDMLELYSQVRPMSTPARRRERAA